MTVRCRLQVAILAAICLAAGAPTATPSVDQSLPDLAVILRPFPCPYRAAVTIAADTHRTTVEKFEAVHRLVNTQDRIDRGSPAWGLLFADPEIDRRPEWRDGIDGFGLPIADSLWLYDPVIGVFAGFDERTSLPIPHADGGRDFRDIMDDWLRRGWIDTLHTPGPGPIPRAATEAGLAWLGEQPHRRLTVWSDHSYTGTPTCLGTPGERALIALLKNGIKYGTLALDRLGFEGLARRIAANPVPAPLPPGQRLLCILLIVVLLGSTGVGSFAAARRPRRPAPAVAGALLAITAAGTLLITRLDYALGDNPGSPYYCADLAARAGIRFYWLMPGTRDYHPETPDRLAIPEWSLGERRIPLTTVTLDDGSPRLAFGRTYRGDGGHQSLELLTDAALADLAQRGGTAILYTHWTNQPETIFTARGLDGLARLRRFRDRGEVWVAPTAEILRFAQLRASLQYGVSRAAGRTIVDIAGVRDPSGPGFVPGVEDLRGICFESPAAGAVEIRVAGRSIGTERVRTAIVDDRRFTEISASQEIARP